MLFRSNADQVLSSTSVINAGSQAITNQPITFTESAPNTGVFGTYDESDVSNLVTPVNAVRGKSASFDFNQKSSSVVIGYGSGTVTIQPSDAEWNSGEKIPVTVVDSDQNKNSRADEDLYLKTNSTSTLIPSMRIGSPFTLGANGTEIAGTIRVVTFTNNPGVTASGNSHGFHNATFTINAGQKYHTTTVKKFSDVAVLNGTRPTGNTFGLLVSYGKTASDLQKVAMDTRSSATTRLHGFDYFNYDVRSLVPSTTSTTVNTYFAYSNSTNLFSQTVATAQVVRVVSLSNATALSGLINVNGTANTDTGFVQQLWNLTGTTKSAYPVGVAFKFTNAVTQIGRAHV